MAGKGAGRKALDDVLRAIDERRYLSIDSLKALGKEVGDLRTALVLTPLFYAARDVPETIVLEQVPSVLPVWERIADELRSWGYSAATAILNAEQYGVPQTRKRAILIARMNGVAKMPTPTHSRFYGNDPTRLDPGVKKWVSMAEALGWETSEGGLYFHPMTYGRRGIWPGDQPAPTIRGENRPMPENYAGHPSDAPLRVRSSFGKPKIDGVNGSHIFDPSERPSHTVTTKVGSWSVEGVEFVSNDKLPHSARRSASEPAPTLTAGHDSANRVWEFGHLPATTIMKGAVRVTVAEAAALQSFPSAMDWGVVSPTAAYKIIGNAVPPLLAEAILREALDL